MSVQTFATVAIGFENNVRILNWCLGYRDLRVNTMPVSGELISEKKPNAETAEPSLKYVVTEPGDKNA